MITTLIYSVTGIALFCMGFTALILCSHLLRKILAINFMASGVFLLLITTAYSPDPALLDPVPQAMVLTGIVVSVSTTALALVLACRVQETTGSAVFKRLLPFRKNKGQKD